MAYFISYPPANKKNEILPGCRRAPALVLSHPLRVSTNVRWEYLTQKQQRGEKPVPVARPARVNVGLISRLRKVLANSEFN